MVESCQSDIMYDEYKICSIIKGLTDISVQINWYDVGNNVLYIHSSSSKPDKEAYTIEQLLQFTFNPDISVKHI